MFEDVLNGHRLGIGLAAFLLTLAYLFLPIRYCINKCASQVWRHDEMTYEKHCSTFLTDYNRSNPMTQKEANLKYLEKMSEAGELDKQMYDQQRQYYSQLGRFGGVMHYGAQVNNIQTRVFNTYQPMVIARPIGVMPQNFGYGIQRMGYNPIQAMPQRYVVRMVQPGAGGNVQYPGMMMRPVMIQRAGYMAQNNQIAAHPQAYQRPSAIVNQPANVMQQPYRPQPIVYQQPSYQQPTYQQPVYQQPVYRQPAAGYAVNNAAQPQYNTGVQYGQPQAQYYQQPYYRPAQANVAPNNQADTAYDPNRSASQASEDE